MVNKNFNDNLAELNSCISKLKLLIQEIDSVKNDNLISLDNKKEKILEFKLQISLINQRVDKIKSEIKLASQYNIN